MYPSTYKEKGGEASMKIYRVAIGIVLCAAHSGAFAQGPLAIERPTDTAGRFTLSTGGEYSTGKYGATESTDIWSVPIIARYDNGPLTLRVAVPWIWITSPGNVIPSGPGAPIIVCDQRGGGSGGSGSSGRGEGSSGGSDRGGVENCVTTTGTTAAQTSRTTQSGLGDVVASASYIFTDRGLAGFGFGATGLVKFGTADENKGLGTGKTDYALQGELWRRMGSFEPYLWVGYRWFGQPAGVTLRNVWYTAVGTDYLADSATTYGLSFFFRESTVSGGQGLRELTPYLSYAIDRNWKLRAYAVFGFSDASPDWGGGLFLSYTF
jgi:hypothetical protein